MSDYVTYIAGTTHVEDRDALNELKPGSILELRREKNDFDLDAIALYLGDKKVGYVPRGDNTCFADLMDEGRLFSAEVKSVTKKGLFYEVEIGIRCDNSEGDRITDEQLEAIRKASAQSRKSKSAYTGKKEVRPEDYGLPENFQEFVDTMDAEAKANEERRERIGRAIRLISYAALVIFAINGEIDWMEALGLTVFFWWVTKIAYEGMGEERDKEKKERSRIYHNYSRYMDAVNGIDRSVCPWCKTTLVADWHNGGIVFKCPNPKCKMEYIQQLGRIPDRE